MSLTGQPASSTSSSGSNVQLIRGALADYAKITGIDLSKDPIAAKFGRTKSPEDILLLLQERANAFEEFRDGGQRLTSTLNPAVRVLHAFSGVLGEGGGTVPFAPTTALFTGIHTLLAAAGGKRSRYDVLIELFERLGNFLRRLEIYTTIPRTSLMTEVVVKIIVELLLVLALATKKIKEGWFRKVTKKLLGETEIEDALQRLDRLTQDEVRMGILHQILHVQLRNDVQHWLSPPNPSTNHNTFWGACHRGTAAWLFENRGFISWKVKGSLLWIHGKPGSGKSTLLSAIIEDIRGICTTGLATPALGVNGSLGASYAQHPSDTAPRGNMPIAQNLDISITIQADGNRQFTPSITMAYYYFDFQDVKKQDRYGLLSSLIFQLSAQSNAYYGVLSRLYAGGIEKPTHSALLKCLKDMLRLPGQAQIFIIVDALDECPNFSGRPSAREEVLELIKELVDLKLPDLRLCVASRPEIDIRMVLESLTHLRISLHDDSGQKEDIITYIKAVVHSDRRMRRWRSEVQNQVIDELSQKADGAFRWVVCQVDTLCYSFPRNIRSVLADLPRGLDKTYEKALLGINKEKREYALRLYQCLTVSIRPLLVKELAEILAIWSDEAVSPMFNAAWHLENAEEVVMSACSSLIAIVDWDGRQAVQFSHFSIKEYLTSERLSTAEERLSYYHILPEPAHTILAHASLSVLLQLNDKIDRRDTIDHFPLALYAAQHWVDHAQFGDVSSHVQELMERLFDPAMPHFAAWVWLHDIDHQPVSQQAAPLYYASLCGFYGLVEHLLVARLQDVNVKGGHHVTSLHAALDKGHVKVAQLLLQHGADVNARDGQHRTPLHIAAEYGDSKVIQSLIDRHADTNAKDLDQSTPLSLASKRGRLGAAQLLLKHDADVGCQDSIGQTPMQDALDNGHYDIVRLLLDSGANINAQGTRSLRTPLHLAADRGELVVSQSLLERGAEVDVRDKMDWSPLHFASQQGHLALMRLLLNRDADVLARNNEDQTGDRGANPNARNKDQEIPLFLASRNGKLEAARLLLEHSADIDSQDSLGRTPLYVAAENGHYDIVDLLVNQGADLDAPEKKRRTPLHLAAHQGMLKVAKLLLECGAEVDARDEMDQTSLHFAAQQGHLELVQLLLEYHADPLALNREGHIFLDVARASGHEKIVDAHARYEGGLTALHIAAQHGDSKLISWLINRELDPIHPNIEDEDQETPLFPASRNGKLDATRLLLDEKAEVNHQDWQKMTPLHGVSENGHDEVAQLLLDRKAEVNAKHKNAWTPLHLASRAGQRSVAKVLLDNDAMVNAENDSNWTPLHMASQEGHSDVVRLLLAYGAKVNIQNEADETALHMAAFYAHLDVAQVLLDHDADLQIKNNKDETPMTLKSKGGKTLLELALERGDDSMARILKLAALGGDPELGEIPVGEQFGEEQVRERVMVPE